MMLEGSGSSGCFRRAIRKAFPRGIANRSKILRTETKLHATYTYIYAGQPKRLLARSSFISRSCFAVSIVYSSGGRGGWGIS